MNTKNQFKVSEEFFNKGNMKNATFIKSEKGSLEDEILKSGACRGK